MQIRIFFRNPFDEKDGWILIPDSWKCFHCLGSIREEGRSFSWLFLSVAFLREMKVR